MRLLACPALLALLLAAAPLAAQPVAAGFAEAAALTLGAPVIVRATIQKADRIAPADAPGLAPGKVRLLVTARLDAAILAPGDVPAQISYLLDIAPDARGKPPRLKDLPVLLFLRPVEGKPTQFQLIGANAQQPADAASEARVRAILGEARGGKVPVVTGIASAFRVPGSIPGEAESQFFLTTRAGKPVSLVLLTRPGQPQRLSVALGDVIDDAAAPVRPDTLLWYRLACFLPRALPPAALQSVEPADRAALEDDYAAVLRLLGPCA